MSSPIEKDIIRAQVCLSDALESAYRLDKEWAEASRRLSFVGLPIDNQGGVAAANYLSEVSSKARASITRVVFANAELTGLLAKLIEQEAGK